VPEPQRTSSQPLRRETQAATRQPLRERVATAILDTGAVAILRQGDYLVASIQSDLTDNEVLALRDDLAERIGSYRTRGLIIDVAALDVIDSFVARSLRSLALTANLHGAETMIVGIQPDVAVAMVHFHLNLKPLRATQDLDEALALLDRHTHGGADVRATTERRS